MRSVPRRPPRSIFTNTVAVLTNFRILVKIATVLVGASEQIVDKSARGPQIPAKLIEK